MAGVTKEKTKKILNTEIKLKTLIRFASTIVALIVLVVLYSRGIIAPIFVNGEPVTFAEIARVMRDEGTSNIIDKIISEKIIEIEAKRRNIEVKQEEISAEMQRIQNVADESGKTMGQLLKESDMTQAQLEKDVKVRVTLYKILGENVDVTEGEIDYYIDNNKEFYGDDSEAVREEVKRLLLEQKISHQSGTWLREAKASSKVNYIVK
jgi:foldase protein PrsA